MFRGDGMELRGEKWICFFRALPGLGIPLHAAGTGFFMVLSVFPILVLLLGLVRYTGLSVDLLTGLLEGIIPQALLPAAKRLILSAYRNTSGAVVSLSALAALWSAGRGISGLIGGLNRMYQRQETRSWIRIRTLSMGYTALLLPGILLVRWIHVWGQTLLEKVLIPEQAMGLSVLLPLVIQTLLFSGMFMVLPNGGNTFRASVPGAVVMCLGWTVFSKLYSWYVVSFTGYANIFGSVYAVALSMLWLYICLCILLFAGAWNHALSQK